MQHTLPVPRFELGSLDSKSKVQPLHHEAIGFRGRNNKDNSLNNAQNLKTVPCLYTKSHSH